MDAEFVASLARDFPRGRKALVGVSGGRDSVALLHALKSAGFRNLVVCHLNHGLRGRASGEDAKFVRRLADKWGFESEVEKRDVVRFAKQRKLSLETAARESRHAFFAEVARAYRCRRIYLAHHADDQVETVLHQLFRGSGMAGLSGMAKETKLSLGRIQLQVARPLLEVWREAIEEYLAENQLSYREDESNADLAAATRNRWRHQLLPAIEEATGRDPRPAVLRLATILRDEEHAIQGLVDEMLADLVERDRLDFPRLRTMPVAWSRRVVKKWLEEEGVPGVGFDLVERARAYLTPEVAPSPRLNLPGNRFLRRRKGRAFVERLPMPAGARKKR